MLRLFLLFIAYAVTPAAMSSVRLTEVPPHSLLSRYVGSGAYVDCYDTEVSGAVSHAQFVEAFYSTPLFKLERLLLRLLASRPSTDAEAKQLARGERSSFAAWRVEARAADEVLLSAGHTRSWLMVGPCLVRTSGTRLLFGSAVVHTPSSKSEGSSLGTTFAWLLPFHRVYSRALLLSAKSRLSSRPS